MLSFYQYMNEQESKKSDTEKKTSRKYYYDCPHCGEYCELGPQLFPGCPHCGDDCNLIGSKEPILNKEYDREVTRKLNKEDEKK